MRGWNYRSKSGINLYLAKAFKTERDLMQGKGRVGRFGDPCDRFRLLENLIDSKLRLAYLNTLNQHLRRPSE